MKKANYFAPFENYTKWIIFFSPIIRMPQQWILLVASLTWKKKIKKKRKNTIKKKRVYIQRLTFISMCLCVCLRLYYACHDNSDSHLHEPQNKHIQVPDMSMEIIIINNNNKSSQTVHNRNILAVFVYFSLSGFLSFNGTWTFYFIDCDGAFAWMKNTKVLIKFIFVLFFFYYNYYHSLKKIFQIRFFVCFLKFMYQNSIKEPKKKREKKRIKLKCRRNLIVSHITWCCTEFSVALDNFVNGFEEIFFGGHFTSGPDCKHTSFRTNRTKREK